MKELVEVIAKALVDCPEEVRVSEEEREDAIVLKLSVAETDMGRVPDRKVDSRCPESGFRSPVKAHHFGH